MASTFSIRRRVQFSETDMAGIMHFANFFRFMEDAEHSFFRSLGFSIVTTQVSPPVGWPRVDAQCKYLKPVRFEDELQVHMTVVDKKEKSLSYTFDFLRVTPEPSEKVAHGTMTVVCVTKDNAGQMKSTPIPKAIANAIIPVDNPPAAPPAK